MLSNLMSQKTLGLLSVAMKMLVSNKDKFLGMIVGTTFASFIMMQQPAIYQGVCDRLSSPILSVKGPDLWVKNPNAELFEKPYYFEPAEVYRVRSIAGVRWAVQLYRRSTNVFYPKTNSSHGLEIIGVDPDTLLGLPKKFIRGERESIKRPDAIVFDADAIKQLENSKKKMTLGDEVEFGFRKFSVTGVAESILAFSTVPRAYVTYNNMKDSRWPSFILVKAMPGVSISKLAKQIQDRTGYVALRPQEFADLAIKYYRQKTPILINFVIVSFLGFIIGLISMGQIFNNLILTHLQQFGMLKIMGTSNRMLINMVLFQAAVAGGIGYVIGLFLVFLFGIAVNNTTIAFHLTWAISFMGAVAMAIIVLISAYGSIRKVLRFDTVELCRSTL